MSTSGRAPLAAVPGLARTAQLPPPPQRRAQERPAAAAKEAVEPVPNGAPAASGTGAKPRARNPQRAASAVLRPVTMSLPSALVVEVKERARRDGVAQPEVLMDALSATRGRLGQLVAAAAAPPASDGLFVRQTKPRGSAGPMSTLSIRLLAENLTVIDALVSEHGAPSRSALCAVALRDYLGESD